MNINKLNELVDKSKLAKQSICERCGFTRPTLDNALAGGDIKISTLKSLAKFFNVPVGYFFNESDQITTKVLTTEDRLLSIIESQQRTIENLTNK
ncbi:MAG: helix-turn-helix domain-containing protein [Tannerellaceae bacterium]|jgi:transcriptional regulator with XRE-family HTH domain|nr:helix-turn-helix domain-containing protein [Tannerellaceae bacterium]